jgi:hypothetical protein
VEVGEEEEGVGVVDVVGEEGEDEEVGEEEVEVGEEEGVGAVDVVGK